MKLALTFILAFLVMMGFDFIWLSLTGDMLYRHDMAGLLLAQYKLAPALGFYVLYTFGLSYLIIRPIVAGTSRLNAGIIGDLTVRAALFGLVAFATYDLTGLAVLKDFPLRLSFIDMGWGALNSLMTANIVAQLLKLFKQL